MRSLVFLLSAAFSIANAGPALHFPLQKRVPSSGLSFSAKTPSPSLSNTGHSNDFYYATEITICEQTVGVLLDTGSSDLWVQPPKPLKGVETTKLNAKIVYGKGEVAGPIALCPVLLGPYSIAKQAFISVTDSRDANDTFADGVFGLLGLSFDTDRASDINHAVHTSDPKAAWGGTVLTNLFYANPKTPNFIAFLFDRTSDLDEMSRGSFTVGETEEQYASVMKQPALPVFPDSEVQRWNVVLDAVSINGVDVPLKSEVKGAPTGKAIALLDSGNTVSRGPPDAVELIYSTIPGSAYSKSEKLWLVPCLSVANVEFTLGGIKHPVHPLDMSLVNYDEHTTACVGGIQELNRQGASDIDWILGDTYLRNVYSTFDFGDLDPSSGGLVGHPFIKLLPLPASEPKLANAEFKTARTAALAKLPPTVDPVAYVAAEANSSSNPPTSNPPASNPPASNPSTSNPSAANIAVANELDAGTVATLEGDMSKIVTFLPVILGLLGANVLIVLLLLIVGCVFFFKRKGTSAYRPVKTYGD